MTQWGIKITNTQIGGVVGQNGQQLKVLGSDSPVDGNPADLRLQPDQQIVLQLEDRDEG